MKIIKKFLLIEKKVKSLVSYSIYFSKQKLHTIRYYMSHIVVNMQKHLKISKYILMKMNVKILPKIQMFISVNELPNSIC